MNAEELTDEQLAAASARELSDGTAFVALVDRFRERVWRICYRLMGDEHEANDAAQEVFVRLFLHRDRFRGESKYATWVHSIAVRTCLAMRRSRYRRQRREAAMYPEDRDRTNADSTAARPDVTIDLARMLGTLDELDRALLIMKYAEGYSYEELSEIFDLSISACKMRVSRARDELKRQFPEHELGTSAR